MSETPIAELSFEACDYIEAMATAHVLADAMELKALQETLGQSRAIDDPCLIGSVKGNLGHLEAAAGMAGLMKLILAIQHGQLPSSVGVDRLHPFLEKASTRLELIQRLTPWPDRSHCRPRRVGGISAFGFGGTNAHVILQQSTHELARATNTDHCPPIKFDAGVGASDSVLSTGDESTQEQSTDELAQKLASVLKQSGF